MTIIGGPYSIAVDAASAAWKVGPIFKPGDRVRIDASGYVTWKYASGGSPVVSAVPSTFTTPQTVTFAIPAGTYVSGTWSIGAGSPSSTTGASIGRDAENPIDILFPYGGGEVINPTLLDWHSGGALNSFELSDVNAAAGGTLTIVVSYATGTSQPHVTFFDLTLVGASGTVYYAQPEGTYPSSYPQTHAFDPPSALTAGAWTGSQLPVSNVRPVSLAAIVLPDGVTPDLLNYGASWESGLQVNRDTLFDYSDLFAAGAIVCGQNYRLWLLFNDGVSDFADNGGNLAVIITRYAGATMSASLTSLLRPQFGVEPTLGGTIAASRSLNCVENGGFDINPEQNKESVGLAGLAFDHDSVMTTEMSKGSVKGIFEYRDIGYVLSSIYGAPTNSTLTVSGSTTSYQHVFEDRPWSEITPQTYFFEYVDAAALRPYSVNKLVFTGLKIDTAADKQASLSMNVFSGRMNDAATPSAGRNDVQTLTVNGVPAGGTFNLVLDDLTLYNVAYNITPANLQTAIRALGGIWAAATVTGVAGTSYVVTNVTGVFVPDFVVDYRNLTGGTTPTVTVAHTTPGGMAIHTFDKVLPKQISVAWAATLSDLVSAPTLLLNEYETAIDISDRFTEVFRQNPTDVDFGDIKQKKAGDLKDSVTFTMAYNSEVATWIANSRAGTKMFIRLAWTGNAIGATGDFLKVIYDACGIPTWKAHKDSQGNIHSVEFMFQVVQGLTSGFRSRWTVVNDLPNYTS